jgi:hypothetical protein
VLSAQHTAPHRLAALDTSRLTFICRQRHSQHMLRRVGDNIGPRFSLPVSARAFAPAPSAATPSGLRSNTAARCSTRISGLQPMPTALAWLAMLTASNASPLTGTTISSYSTASSSTLTASALPRATALLSAPSLPSVGVLVVVHFASRFVHRCAALRLRGSLQAPHVPHRNRNSRIRRWPAAASGHGSAPSDRQRNTSRASTASSPHRRRHRHRQCVQKVGALGRRTCACPVPTGAYPCSTSTNAATATATLAASAPAASSASASPAHRQHSHHQYPVTPAPAAVTSPLAISLPPTRLTPPQVATFHAVLATMLLTAHRLSLSSRSPQPQHSNAAAHTVLRSTAARHSDFSISTPCQSTSPRRSCPHAPRRASALARLTPTQVPPQLARSCYPASAASALGAAIAPSPSPQVRALDSLSPCSPQPQHPSSHAARQHRSHDVHFALALHASRRQ